MIFQIKLVKIETEIHDNGLVQRVVKELSDPWPRLDQIVCANSIFCSLPQQKLWSTELRFVGVIKNVMQSYPMLWLLSFEFASYGCGKGLLYLNADRQLDLLAFVWMDRDRDTMLATISCWQKVGCTFECISIKTMMLVVMPNGSNWQFPHQR